MKAIKTFLKPISYLLAFLVLFQGCTVYKTQNLSLEEATATQDKVKLKTKQNKTHHYLYITKDGDKYYGVKEVHDQLIKMELPANNIEIIRAKDNRASKTASILLGVVGGLVIVIGVFWIAAVESVNSIID